MLSSSCLSIILTSEITKYIQLSLVENMLKFVFGNEIYISHSFI